MFTLTVWLVHPPSAGTFSLSTFHETFVDKVKKKKKKLPKTTRRVRTQPRQNFGLGPSTLDCEGRKFCRREFDLGGAQSRPSAENLAPSIRSIVVFMHRRFEFTLRGESERVLASGLGGAASRPRVQDEFGVAGRSELEPRVISPLMFSALR